MRDSVACRLNQLSQAFYDEEADSFSRTRRASWPGWTRCLELAGARPAGADAGSCLRVLDVACGNLRFARFLSKRWAEARVSYDAVDACPELAAGWVAPRGWRLACREQDVIADLLAGKGGARGGKGGYDLVVCFGFFHHVPTSAARLRLVRDLVAQVRPGGTCCVSLWRFLSDRGLARKARATTEAALADLGLGADELDPGDCLLGWQGHPHVWRYCHSFDETEAGELAEAGCAAGASLSGRFLADGRTGELNEYLVFRRT